MSPLTVVSAFTLIYIFQVSFSLKHMLDKWGTEIKEGFNAKSEIMCATACSLNETCSSYIYNKEQTGKKTFQNKSIVIN